MSPELKDFCVLEPDRGKGKPEVREKGQVRGVSSVLQGLWIMLRLRSAAGVLGGCAGRAVGEFTCQIIWMEGGASAWMDG